MDLWEMNIDLLEVQITTRLSPDQEGIDMPIDKVLSLLAFAQKNGASCFVVSGGEASLHPQFDSLAEALIQIKPAITTVLETNGAIRTKEPEKMKGFKIIHVSYEPDGFEAGTADSQENIQLVRDLNEAGIYAYLLVTVHQGNVDKIDSMVEMAKTAGESIGFNLCCVPMHKHSDLVLSPEQTLQASEKLYGLFLDRKIVRFTSPWIVSKHGCAAGITACAVTPSGDVVPCPFLKTLIAGNIYKRALEEIWLDSGVFGGIRRRKTDNLCVACRFAPFCGGCRAKDPNLSGESTEPDKECLIGRLG